MSNTTKTKSYTHRVITHDTGSWSACGYLTRGLSIYCEGVDQARRIARSICGGPGNDDIVEIDTDGGTYWYSSQEAADRDDTGATADALVCELTDEDYEMLADLLGESRS